MLRLSILGFGAYAAVCMVSGSASAEDINLRCSGGVGSRGDVNLRINLSDSTVNGEKVDRIVKGPGSGHELSWRAPANVSVQAAYFLLDLSKGRLDVIGHRFCSGRPK